MKQTHILELPGGLKVTFTMVEYGADIMWSRKLFKKDMTSLRKFYVPWRDSLLFNWASRRNKPLDFVDLPLLELMLRVHK